MKWLQREKEKDRLPGEQEGTAAAEEEAEKQQFHAAIRMPWTIPLSFWWFFWWDLAW